jgi:CHASE3 domain sensor protein|tara:strand:- start:7503 stop:7949 length:447 start_codon:yes stop_codon:yes gene_type:complete
MPDKLATDVEILKREVADMKLIHGRLDNAITKITDVSNSINRMLAVHEEKLASQEDAIARQETDTVERKREFEKDVEIIHERIRTTKDDLSSMMSKQHEEQSMAINSIKKDLKDRVGVLERWRWLLIGGCIVIGFIIHKMMNFSITIA